VSTTSAVVDIHAHVFPTGLPDLSGDSMDPRWPRLVTEPESGRIMCGQRTFRQVRPALNRSKPYVHGWVSGRMRQASLMDVQTDFTVTLTDGSHPVYAVDEFALIAHKL